ncbi:MAG: DoxX family membrane protein [Acidimicrobiia bacterium]|nr:DoxX family membrane protein [Acidimicrobiia bacterium]
MDLMQIDRTIRRLLGTWAIPLLRISLGIVFVWFGALKVLDVTPVTDLVAETVYWVDPDWFVPLLGWVEVVVGVALLVRRGLRLMLPVFLAQMLGTFLVLIVQPEVAFQDGNLFKLTVEGEFVVKNLVLLSAGLVVGATVDGERIPVDSDPDVLVP